MQSGDTLQCSLGSRDLREFPSFCRKASKGLIAMPAVRAVQGDGNIVQPQTNVGCRIT